MKRGLRMAIHTMMPTSTMNTGSTVTMPAQIGLQSRRGTAPCDAPISRRPRGARPVTGPTSRPSAGNTRRSRSASRPSAHVLARPERVDRDRGEDDEPAQHLLEVRADAELVEHGVEHGEDQHASHRAKY